MRVLCVTHYFSTNGGGIEIVADRLRGHLRARGWRVRWLACSAGSRVTDSRPIDDDCIAVPAWDGVRLLTDLSFPIFGPGQLRVVWREVREADVVHLHEPYFPLNQAVLIVAQLLGRPVLLTQHIADMPIRGLVRGRAVGLANWLLGRPAYALSERIVCVGRRTAAQFASWAPERLTVIYNGCDSGLFAPCSPGGRPSLRRQLGLGEEAPVCLFVGRFIEKKGLARLEALARYRGDVQFVLIGRGPVRPQSWNLPNVRALAPMRHGQLCGYYQAADALVLPSVGEGFPLVVQEALCAGIRGVVSSEIIAACPEAAPLLADAGPGGNRLNEVIDQVLATPLGAQEAAERAAVAARLWSWDQCADAYRELFVDIDSRRRKRR